MRVMDANIAQNMRAVPRSGCLAMRIKGTKSIASGAISSLKSSPFGGTLTELKCLAKAMIKAIFANSEGWKDTKPRDIHLCAPATVRPIVKARMRLNMLAPNMT